MRHSFTQTSAADSHRLHRGVEFRRCRSDYPHFQVRAAVAKRRYLVRLPFAGFGEEQFSSSVIVE